MKVIVCLIFLIFASATGAGSHFLPRTLFRNRREANLALAQKWLIGTFTNKIQAEKDALAGAPTAREGGHEHVMLNIARVAEDLLRASYYFGEDSTRVFRFRYYQLAYDEVLHAPRMRIYRPRPETEAKLKQASYDVSLMKEPLELSDEQFEYLQGCDLIWTKRREFPCFWRSCFQGVLAEGTCYICSQSDPTVQLLVKDNLRLSKDSIWINDRVYTSSGVQIIGNSKGIPYKMVKIKD